MNRQIFAGLCTATALAIGGVVLAQQLPDAPAKGFGASITPAYEGWYDNADGSHTFLIGYYNRNVRTAMDIPIGPNNHIDPGGPDLGQPTHFLPGRQTGLFSITVPKAFAKDQKLTWTIVANGEPMVVPFRLNVDYNVSPFTGLEIGNTPPSLHLFEEKAAPAQGPVAFVSKALAKTATVASGLVIPIWAEDDAKYSSGTNAPLTTPRPPVSLSWSMFRGPKNVKFESTKLDTIKGGKVDEPYTGKLTTTVTFAEPGEYYLEVLANDYSGPGGGGEVCCWTTALVKVNVTP
jgi:hypothetical protein